MPEADRRDRATAEVIANRLRMAANYLRDARTLKATGSRTCSFCLFMAAELTLLAVLASEDGSANSRDAQHQLGAMTDRLPDDNPTKPAFKLIEALTGYATTFRYTTPSGRIPPEMSDADFVLYSERVEKLIAVCARWFGVADLALQSTAPARVTHPIRLTGPAA